MMSEELRINELSEEDLENVKLPYVVKNHILMSPGVWNNYRYTKMAIKEGLENTEWSQKRRSLFWEHNDESAKEWVGDVKNMRFKNGNLVGDVYVIDRDLAVKLAYGAKFGVSPKVAGIAGYNNEVKNATFENFSIVLNPAVKTTFLNSEIKKVEEDTMTEKEEKNELKELKGMVSNLTEEINAIKEEKAFEEKVSAEVEKRLAEMKEDKEEEKKDEEKEDEEEKKENEEKDKKKYPYPKEMKEEIDSLKKELEELKKGQESEEEDAEELKEDSEEGEELEEDEESSKEGPAGDVESDLEEAKSKSEEIANELREMGSLDGKKTKFSNNPTRADVGTAEYLRGLVE